MKKNSSESVFSKDEITSYEKKIKSLESQINRSEQLLAALNVFADQVRYEQKTQQLSSKMATKLLRRNDKDIKQVRTRIDSTQDKLTQYQVKLADLKKLA